MEYCAVWNCMEYCMKLYGILNEFSQTIFSFLMHF